MSGLQEWWVVFLFVLVMKKIYTYEDKGQGKIHGESEF